MGCGRPRPAARQEVRTASDASGAFDADRRYCSVTLTLSATSWNGCFFVSLPSWTVKTGVVPSVRLVLSMIVVPLSVIETTPAPAAPVMMWTLRCFQVASGSFPVVVEVVADGTP